MAENGSNQPQITVVMVPFPAQGHLNQLLHLSRLIAAYKLPVHILSTTTHTRQAKTRIPLTSAANIHFHDFPTPHFPSPPPDPNSGTKFPSHLIPSWKSSSYLRQPFVDLLSKLSPAARRVVVVFDYLMGPVVQDVVSFPNAEAYMFSCFSAFTSCCHFLNLIDDELEELRKQTPSTEDTCSADDLEFFRSTDVSCQRFTSGIIQDSCRVVEGKFIDLLEQDEVRNNKLWALGPFNPVAVKHKENSSHNHHKLFEWLDKQAPNSVIYVSFGTTTSLSNEQIRELALGLEESGQKFIWVARDADKGDIFDGEVRKIELPEGFEERLEMTGVGFLVRDWAPQLEILGHPSTGGFMSHCGWNSSMEGITMGVPIAAWPMHSDQPRNSMLITEVLKIGLLVRDWAHRDELVTRSRIRDVVRRLMDSDEIRKQAAELGQNVRRSVEEGGVTRKELDSFITHVSR